MSQALELNRENFQTEVLASATPVLVDFWAPWCMPCKMMAPILDELAADLAGQVKIAKINTEEAVNQELAQQYEIQSIPNLKLFKDGKVLAEFIGLRDKASLSKDILAALEK
ncbi:MAG TPA: thioredoxin [bacterium]|nr:thioredoxin [bacterium]HPT29765.1 thioredoxin [bacterium]